MGKMGMEKWRWGNWDEGMGIGGWGNGDEGMGMGEWEIIIEE